MKGQLARRAVLSLPMLSLSYNFGGEEVVKEFADFLNKQSDLQVVIEGHTDSIGSKEWNRKLSQLRADAVRLKNRRVVAAL